MPYAHLTILEREIIAQMYFSKNSLGEIARRLGRAKSTISREIKRNAVGGVFHYMAFWAQSRAWRRRKDAKSRSPDKLDHPRLKNYVLAKLDKTWSPEQIAGRISRDFPRDRRMRVSHETIYQWIKADKRQGASCTSGCDSRIENGVDATEAAQKRDKFQVASTSTSGRRLSTIASVSATGKATPLKGRGARPTWSHMSNASRVICLPPGWATNAPRPLIEARFERSEKSRRNYARR